MRQRKNFEKNTIKCKEYITLNIAIYTFFYDLWIATHKLIKQPFTNLSIGKLFYNFTRPWTYCLRPWLAMVAITIFCIVNHHLIVTFSAKIHVEYWHPKIRVGHTKITFVKTSWHVKKNPVIAKFFIDVQSLLSYSS